MFANVKSPFVFVKTPDDWVPCVSLMSITAAPGMTPPCGSLTVPVTEAVVICAEAGNAHISASIATAATLRALLDINSDSLCVLRDASDVAPTRPYERGRTDVDERRDNGCTMNAPTTDC